MSTELRKDIKPGQIFRSIGANNRYMVLSVGFNNIRVEALDGGRFGDCCYNFHPDMFGTTMLLSSEIEQILFADLIKFKVSIPLRGIKYFDDMESAIDFTKGY
jgi:hypothetical protein